MYQQYQTKETQYEEDEANWKAGTKVENPSRRRTPRNNQIDRTSNRELKYEGKQ